MNSAEWDQHINGWREKWNEGIGKSVSPDVSSFLNGTDIEDQQGAKLVIPYAQSAWIYIAVSRLAQKVAQIPFRISRVGSGQGRRIRALRHSADPRHRDIVRRALGETIIDSGPAVDLFNRPHPSMTRQLFWEMLVTWLSLRGEFFILPMDDSDCAVDLNERSPNVSRLITLPTELFYHIVTGYELTAWRYTGSPLLTPIPSEILLPSEVIHCRTPNPYLYWRGMSPLIVAMVAAGADYAASKYSQGYWLNNADTGVIVTTEQQADETQRAAILAALRERKRKAGTADRPLFLWGGAKIEKPQLSGMETQFIENRKMNRQEIGAIFKVPDSVMGFSEAKASALSGGGSALDSEQVSFIENSITPICSHAEDGLAPVVRTFGDDVIGWFDIDSLPIMQEARRARLESAAKAFALGVPFNDINRAYDLGFQDYKWGDDAYLPFNIQKVGGPTELPGEDDPANAGKEDDESKSSPFKRFEKFMGKVNGQNVSNGAKQRKPDTAILWQSHIASRRKTVNLFQSKVGKVLNDFRRKTLAKLDEVHLEKTIVQRSLVDIIFDQHAFGTELLAQLHNPILATLDLAGAELLKEIGSDDPWKTPPAAAKKFIAERTQAIMGVGGTVRDQLNTSLQEGLDAGETHAQLSDRVRSVYTSLGNYEAKRVAMTEVNMAYNSSRHLAMTDSGIGYKAWLSSHGPTVREGHAAAEEQYIDEPIPVDEPFLVELEGATEEMMFPGDDSLGASAGNIINCQCIQLAAQKKEEDEKSITFMILGVGLMRFPKKANL